MKTEALLKAIIEYGIDEKGVRDRFGDSRELYAKCLCDFADSPKMNELAEALAAKEYDSAFDAAHMLKGSSGNLGLSAYYSAVCTLVESLRSKSYGGLTEEYEAVAHEFRNIRRICAGNKPKPAASAAPAKGRKDGRKRFFGKFGIAAASAIIVIILIAGTAFYEIGYAFRDKVMTESGQHLMETGRQIGRYLEEQSANDWRIARSVGSSIDFSDHTVSDEEIISLLQKKKEEWEITDLLLYAENGYCISSDGTVEMNGTSSDTLAYVRKHGSTMTVLASQLIYTVPTDTTRTLRGSRIAAVSVVRSMDTFFDDLNINSFNNKAWIYLTDDSGVVICMLTKGDTVFSFNIGTILDKYRIKPIGGADMQHDMFSSSGAFFMTGSTENRYLATVPITAETGGSIPLRLFYIVPEQEANYSSNRFSSQLTGFSILIIVIIGALSALVFVAMYVSRKRRFASELSSREHMFDLLIRNTRTVFGLFDADRTEPVYMSANCASVLGEEWWSVDRTSGCRAVFESGRESEMFRQANALLKDWDGKSIFTSGYLRGESAVTPEYFEMILYPVGDTEGRLVGIIQEVTAAHNREEVTRTALEMAKRSDEAKTRFLANVSHEMRTPMNAITNMARFALEDADNAEKRNEYLNTICESSEHLLRLINDVLDMSRIESGEMSVAAEPFDIRSALRSQTEAIRVLCAAKHQKLFVDFEGIRTAEVVGDSLKVTQIISNLLSNAVKFTPEGGAVRFIVSELPSLRDDAVSMRFSVEDTGIGISDEDKRHIFEPFSRANDRRVSRIEGTGLGLSICRSYVEAMGGTISCESGEGEGSIFTVELVFRRADADKKEGDSMVLKSNTPFLGMRCLVVEDIHVNQVIAKVLLERVGFTVDIAENGSDGVRKFVSSSPQTYDAIYMDIQMPVMDGYRATEMIRNSGHPQAKTIPILAMSANVFAEDVEKARVAGMDGYIGKPIVLMELMEQTIRVFQTRKGEKE